MRLVEILRQDAVLADMSAGNKKDVLAELCAVVSETEGVACPPLLDVLLEREKLGSTGIGEGVAIPHGKSKLINNMVVVCGRSLKGVDFESIDGRSTHIFFLLLAPESSAGIHLKALARISRLLKDSSFRHEFLSVDGPEAIYDLIDSRDSDF
ncbi:MAG: PTS sugar transporter subunit IIA [Deltaproteobacteria bacterium]|nr:PTS sugar transporter subunit IIA [Deltaproteobacteria bacterium]